MGSRVWKWTPSKSPTCCFVKPSSKSKPSSDLFPPKTQPNNTAWLRKQIRGLAVIIVEKKKDDKDTVVAESSVDHRRVSKSKSKDGQTATILGTEERLERKRNERHTYLVAALMSTVGVSSASIFAVYYRFYCQIQGGEFPVVEMLGTFSLAVGSAVGMEFWARWAHRALWHASLWNMHRSHHRPREGPFEVNDVFAIVNAAPAIALLCYGSFNNGLFPGLCFGAGLGITMFGMAYMFVHDGFVHRRFPVGPIANAPYLKKIAAAHRLHHSEKFDGVPYGLFLGPKELELVGGMEELKKEIERINKQYNIKIES